MTDELVSARFGDIIGVFRGPTKHYGVYVNDDSVVHYAPYIDEFEQYHYIRETTLDRFLHGRGSYFVCIFPEACAENGQPDINSGRYASLTPSDNRAKLLDLFRQSPHYRVFTPGLTVERALSRVGARDYNASISNCESFVTWCKTGICEPSQVKLLLDLIPNLAAVLALK